MSILSEEPIFYRGKRIFPRDKRIVDMLLDGTQGCIYMAEDRMKIGEEKIVALPDGATFEPLGISREQFDELITAMNRLAAAIELMPKSITIYPADYRQPGGGGGGGNGF